MKKITTILMLLMLTCMGAKADVVTTWTTAGSIVTKDALVASAGTGARYAFRMPSNSQPGWCGFNSTTGRVDILDVDHLFTIENGTGDAVGKFWLKRYSNGEYLTGNNEFSATPTIGLTLTDRVPDNVTDYDTGYSDSTPFVSFDNDEGKHYNNGNSNYDFRGGTGGWSVYVTYGPFYIVTVDCQEGGTSMEGYPQTLIVTENTTIEAPEFVGKAVQGTDSYTISEDQNITFNYQAASTFDYTLVVNGAPDGTTITILGESVSAGAVSFDSEVTQSDVVVTFPTGYESYVATVTIDGTTITVNCAYKQTVITEVSEITSNKVYTVESQGRGAWTMASDGSALRSTKASGASTTAKQWAFVTYDSNTYLYNVETKNFILKNAKEGSAEATHGTPVTIIKYTADQMDGWGASFDEFQASGHYFAAQMGTDGDYTAYINFGGSYQTTVDGWGPGNAPGYNEKCGADAGNALRITEVGEFDPTEALTALDNYFNPQYTINYIVKDEAGATLFSVNDIPTTEGATITTLPEAYQRSLFYTYNTVDVTITESVTTIEFTATPKEDAPFEFTADTSAPVWYNLTLSAAPNYVTYVAGGDQNVQLPTTLTDDETTQWAFIGNPYDGFQLVNKAAGTDLVLGSGTTTGSGNTGGNTYATLQSKGSQVNEVWTAKASTSISGKNGFFLFNTENHALNKRNGTANISYWTGGYDAGSTFVATKVLSDEEKYNELIALLESYELGDNLHEYGFEGYTTSEATTAISNLKAEGYTPENMTAAQNLAAAAKLNLPKAGMFLRIKSNAHGTYLSGVASTNPANRMTLTTDADANTIFYFDGNKMLTYGNGLYAKGRDVAKAIGDGEGSGEGVDYWFEESTITPAQYAIRFNPDGGTNRFLYAWGTDKNYADQNGADHVNCVFTLEEVKELPVTLHEAGCKDGVVRWFATFSAPVSVLGVEGAEIHKVTDKGTYLMVEPDEATSIPAGTAVLLVTESDPGDAPATVFLGEANDAITTDLLPLYACEKGKEGLFFGKGGTDGYAGFYTIDADRETGGFKGYVANDGNEAKELVFDNDATGVETIDNGQLTIDNAAMYNLQGQKVKKAQKGVYIINNKKVVVK